MNRSRDELVRLISTSMGQRCLAAPVAGENAPSLDPPGANCGRIGKRSRVRPAGLEAKRRQQADKAKDSERPSPYRLACEGGNGRGCLYLAENVPDKLAYWRACGSRRSVDSSSPERAVSTPRSNV